MPPLIKRVTTFLRGSGKSGFGKFLFQTGIYGFGSLTTPILAFLLVPIYARVLTTAEYGQLAIVLTVQTFLEMVVGLCLSDAAVRIYYSVRESVRLATLSTCLIAVIAAATLITGTLFALERVVAFSALLGIEQRAAYDLMLLAVLFMSIRKVIMSGLRAQQRARAYVVLTVGATLGTMVAKVVFVAFLHQGVVGAMRGAAAGGAIGLVLGLAFILLGQHRWKWSFNLTSLRAALRFALPLVPFGFLNWIKEAAPRYFLLWFASATAVGQLKLATALIGPLSTFIMSPLRQSWAPLIYAIKNEKHQKKLIREGLFGIVVLLCWGGLGIAIFRSEIVNLVLSSKHISVIPLIPLLLLARIIQEVSMPLQIAINTKSKTEIHPIAYLVGALLMVGLCAFLVPLIGIWGAVYSTLFSSAGIIITYWIATQKVAPLSVSICKIAGILSIALVLLLIGDATMNLQIWVSIPIRALLWIAFPIITYNCHLLDAFGDRIRSSILSMSGVLLDSTEQ